MRFLAGLVIAVLFIMIFNSHLKRFPHIFYGGAFLFDALLITGNHLSLPPWFNEYVLFLFQSNTLAMGLFTIVMFIGILNQDSALRKALVPIRAEVSIIASILSLGHMIKYGSSYLSQIVGHAAFELPSLRLAATLTAFLLTVLLIPLAISSIKRVRIRMSPSSWNRLQKLAYLFYGLVFVHILLYLIPSALGGSTASTISVFVYLLLGLNYALLRVKQAEASNRESRKMLPQEQH